jgi:hypothetical protein
MIEAKVMCVSDARKNNELSAVQWKKNCW